MKHSVLKKLRPKTNKDETKMKKLFFTTGVVFSIFLFIFITDFQTENVQKEKKTLPSDSSINFSQASFPSFLHSDMGSEISDNGPQIEQIIKSDSNKTKTIKFDSNKSKTIKSNSNKTDHKKDGIKISEDPEKKALRIFQTKNINRKYELFAEALISKIDVEWDPKYLTEETQKKPEKETTTQALIKAATYQMGNNGKTKRGISDKSIFSRKFPKTDFELRLGSKIPAILETAINSELSGMIMAIVSNNIYDSATGKHLLIPQGSQLVGVYENTISHGQSRVMIAWNRINFPDASYLDLPSMPGASNQGQSGFHDKVNNHYLKIFTNATMLSLISAGVNLAMPNGSIDNRVRDEVSGELAKNLGSVAANILRKNMDIAPTITIRAGYQFTVLVNHDFSFLEPYTPCQTR